MVSQLVKERLKNSVGKYGKIFLKDNNFCYEGKITGCDDLYVEVLNSRNGKYKIILISDIKDAELPE